MASQDVVVTYRAEVDDLTQKLKLVIDRMDRLETESKQAAKGLDVTTKSADKLDKELNDVGKSTKKASDNIKGFSKTAKTEFSDLGASVKSIGLGLAAGLGAALSVEAIFAFSKASVNAFLEAQETAEKLRFTITQVGGESELAFQRLIDQSAKLQKITIFSDDSLQNAQNALATFGLTATEIENLLPKLADFASATKTDIVQAAQQVGAGLQGTGREFKKYGIEVSATSSAMENLAAITEGFTRFQGAAAKETETLSGQLKQQANAVDDLQEQLGSKLAPIFVRLKTVVFEAALGLLGFNKALEEVADQKTSAIESNILKSADKIKQAGKDVVAEFSNRVTELKAVNEKAGQDIEAINKRITDRITELSRSARDITPDDDALVKSLRKQIEATEAIIAATNTKINAFQSVIEKEQQLISQSERTLTLDGLRKKSIEELNTLLIENNKLNDLVSQANVDLINKEIEARKKLAEEAKKNADIRIAGSAAEIESLKRLSSEYSALFELLSDQDKSQLIELSITAQIDNADQIQDKIKQLEAIFKANDLTIPVKVEAEDLPDLQQQFDLIKTELEAQGIAIPIDITQLETLEAKVAALRELATDSGITIPVQADPDQSIEGLQRRFNQLKTELEAKGVTIPVSVNETALEEFRAKVAQLKADQDKELTIPIKLEVPDTKEFTDMVDGIKEGGDEIEASFENISQAAANLFSSLSALYSAYADKRVQEINRVTEDEIEQLDRASEYNQEQLDKRNISEREFANRQKKLEEDKVKAQEAADKKSREIKRKAAILDKAAAIFQIIIDTARAIAEVSPVVPLMALAAATGAAQTAIVAAQPIPYKKGTKSAKGGLSQVDEQGSEAILRVREGRLTVLDKGDKVLPAHKTVTYGKVLDTMFDGTFDKHYMKKEMAPRLVKQRELHEKAEKKSFARNISESLVINSQLNTDPIARQLGKGVSISNLDELYNIIDQNRVSPYRR